MSTKEKIIIIFLVSAAIAGTGIAYLNKLPHEKIRVEPISYDKASEEACLAILQKRIININTAGPEALTSIPGIGPSLARRIIEYRQKNGPFTSAEGLIKVRGIGPKKFQSLKQYIRA